MANLYNVPLKNAVQHSLAATLTQAETSTITLDSSVASELQASATMKGLLVVDRVDVNGNLSPTKTEYIAFTGVSGSTVTGLTRGLGGTTAQGHAIGAIVEFVPDVVWAQAINDVITTEHDADGQHKINTFSNLNAPEGFLINGKIVPSVSSNNLTVALKTLAGNDPSTSDPIYVRINGVIRTITSAVSMTYNAGTNYLNMGSAELATKETDLFVYLSWKASTSEVLLGISRLPYGNKVGDLSQTVTDGNGCLYSAAGSATSDALVNIGRFAATLSAGAGHTWSVPTFDSSNLIQRPIYETRTLAFASSVYGTGGSLGTYAQTTYQESYQIRGSIVFLGIYADVTNKGSWSGDIRIALPMSAKSGAIAVSGGIVKTNGSELNTSLLGPLSSQGTNALSADSNVGVSGVNWSSLTASFRYWVTGHVFLA